MKNNKIKKKLTNWEYVTSNWLKGVLFITPIALTIWAVYTIILHSISFYVSHTRRMAEFIVTDVFEVAHNASWFEYSMITTFHIMFILCVLVGLFILAEITGTKFGQKMQAHIDTTISLVPVGSIIYKMLKLISSMINSSDGDEGLIYCVGLTRIIDGAGNVTYRPCYVLGDGKDKFTDANFGPDTMLMVYYGHAPNPSSGNGAMVRKNQLLLCPKIELAEFATQNAMLGHGLAEKFQAYVDDDLTILRRAGHILFGDQGVTTLSTPLKFTS